ELPETVSGCRAAAGRSRRRGSTGRGQCPRCSGAPAGRSPPVRPSPSAQGTVPRPGAGQAPPPAAAPPAPAAAHRPHHGGSLQGNYRPLLESLSLAARAHHHQVRKDEKTPYVSHVFRVVLIIRHVFGIDDSHTLIAAALHDTLEDTVTDWD